MTAYPGNLVLSLEEPVLVTGPSKKAQTPEVRSAIRTARAAATSRGIGGARLIKAQNRAAEAGAFTPNMLDEPTQQVETALPVDPIAYARAQIKNLMGNGVMQTNGFALDRLARDYAYEALQTDPEAVPIDVIEAVRAELLRSGRVKLREAA